MAKILLGVSGGIAAYKAVEFVRLATAAGHSLRVVMTASARRFVGAATFEGILGAPVLTSEFERDPMRGAYPGEPLPDHDPISHLAVVEAADVFLVAPASANTLAKLAAGEADSMLTTSFLACEAPRLVAPAMNGRMYAARATQDNLERLRGQGVEVIEPGTGPLASKGEYGTGRLPEPAGLLERVERAVSGDLQGVRVMITAGGTREPIDQVRFIGNRSSGRMGLALASRAVARGAEVRLVAANVSLPHPPGAQRIDVESTSDLEAACVKHFPECDMLLMAAAPADFRPAESVPDKISRGSGELRLSLVPTADILAALAGSRRDDQTVVGFAAEHGGDALARAREKRVRKGVDLVVLNDVSLPGIGFDSTRNAVTVVGPGEPVEVPEADKEVVADAILDQALAVHRERPAS